MFKIGDLFEIIITTNLTDDEDDYIQNVKLEKGNVVLILSGIYVHKINNRCYIRIYDLNSNRILFEIAKTDDMLLTYFDFYYKKITREE